MKSKYIIIVFLLVILFLGLICCEYYENERLCDVKVKEKKDYVCEECDKNIKITTLSQALTFVANYIKYQNNDEHDYFKLPEEVYEDGEGDCEDYASLLLYIACSILGIEDCYAVVVVLNGSYHVIVKINGRYYEPQIGLDFHFICKEIHIIHEIPYYEFIWMVYYYHELVGKYY